MPYIDGFVVPVPTGKREEYRAHEAKWWPTFRDMGATAFGVGWGDDVPHGKQTDFFRAVDAALRTRFGQGDRLDGGGGDEGQGHEGLTGQGAGRG